MPDTESPPTLAQIYKKHFDLNYAAASDTLKAEVDSVRCKDDIKVPSDVVRFIHRVMANAEAEFDAPPASKTDAPAAPPPKPDGPNEPVTATV